MDIIIDNLKILIDQIFITEPNPNAVINIYYNGKLEAIIGKEEWEDDSKFREIKELCEMYDPPSFVRKHSLLPFYYFDLEVNHNDK